MSVGVITSAAYISSDMAAEFGLLPPAFLPVGNARLFKHQAKLLCGLVDRIVLTLPESFEVAAHDAALLEREGIEVVRIPDGISLAESVMLAIISGLDGDEALTILHGDTLFLEVDAFAADRFSVHHREHPYPWAVVDQIGDTFSIEPANLSAPESASRGVVSGLFSFSHSTAFLKCLSKHKTDFLGALNCYAKSHPEFAPLEDRGQWLDFGHLNTYYESRRMLTTERAFNTLDIRQNVVTKKSAQPGKMEAEAHWFEAVPAELRSFTPAYLGRTHDNLGYRLDYEYLCPLNDLMVFGALSPRIWQRILLSCDSFLSLCREKKPSRVQPEWFDALYLGKTFRRISEFAPEMGIDIAAGWRLNGRPLPSLETIVEEVAEHIGEPGMSDCGIMHGDFCMSNILFDFRRGSIKLIDPRGYIEPGVPDIYGDTRYDAGKLHHSIAGKYDFLVAGYFDLSRNACHELDFHIPEVEAQLEIKSLFDEIICKSDTARTSTADAISILLFLSMLPLHADQPHRQLAFLANALRLYEARFA